MKVEEILESCLYVDDLDAAEEFYGTVLGLRLYAKAEGRHVFFRCGWRMFLLFDPTATELPDSGVPAHGARGRGHVAFAISLQDVPGWKEWLDHHGVEVEQIVEWPEGGHSLYFRDPAGNSVELATPATWRINEGKVFGPPQAKAP